MAKMKLQNLTPEIDPGSVQVRRVDDDSSVATPIRLYDDPTANEEDASYFDILVKYYVNSRVGNVEVTSYKKG